MFLLFVGLFVVALWIVKLVGRLNRAELRIAEIEQVAKDARAKADQVARLTARVAALEAAAPRTFTTPSVSTPVPPPRVAPAQPEPVQPVPHPPIPPPMAERVPPPAALPPVAAVEPVPAAPAAIAAEQDAWEVTVGGNWLSKIGVLVFVIGLAMLVGWSVTHVGPAGRIAIGFTVSLSLLVTGVTLERRDEYRSYAYALIAGGWAGAYFTTYAMRAVEAARVLESDVTAIVCLSAVAAAMVWHSLRYRSQEVTSLAYVVAYATLALTPLHVFSLTASVPLAVSVLVVAHKFSWPRIQILGVVFTYGLFVLRGSAFGFGAPGGATYTPYIALAAYWLMFEIADLLAVRKRENDLPPAPVFLLNAAGLVGAGLLQLPPDNPLPLSRFLTVAGVASLGSAIARARLGARPSDAAADGASWGSHQAASAIAVATVAWALELRFTGSRLVLALLMEAELVFLSGLILRDRITRGIGSALAILVGLHALDIISSPRAASLSGSWGAGGAAAVAGLTAVVWYANREWLRSRQIALLRHEWLFTPVATYLVVLIALARLSMSYSSLAILIFSLALLEAGLRRGAEYRYQAYTTGVVSAVALLAWFGEQARLGTGSADEAWGVLLSAMAVAWLAAWRISPARGTREADRWQRVWAAATAGAFGTAFLIMLEWIVVAPDYVVLAWTATAAVIGGAGLQLKMSGLRWQVYPLLTLALLRALRPVLASPSATSIQIASALVVAGVLYLFSLAVRQAMTHSNKIVSDVEDAVRMALSVAATLSLAGLIFVQVRPTLVTVTWGALAAVLLATGFPTRERLLRLSGLGVLLACITRLFVFDLPQLEELARIISFVALGAVLLSVSWIYTRYRARIQKYL